MDNPEYTQGCINAALGRVTCQNIKVAHVGDGADFRVRFDGDDTTLWVQDNGSDFDVLTQTGPQAYAAVGSARRYGALAELLVKAIDDHHNTGEQA